MKRPWTAATLLVAVFWSVLVAAQTQNGKLGGGTYQDKVDPRLFIRQELAARGLMAAAYTDEELRAFVHFDRQPSAAEVAELERLGATVHEESWIPPLPNHPTGFVIVDIPWSRLPEIAAYAFVKRVTSAQEQLSPANDLATAHVGCRIQWQSGYDGSGVRLAILDSGLDLNHPDIPPPLACKDYSHYPILDDTIANHVTGHGTHVTGTALGRGTQSSGRYRGAAPGADLIFLKIGDDITGSATTDAMVGAIKNAVDAYNAQVISISYGGWGSYHDGSEEDEQAVDYAVSKGAAVFTSAGNRAEDDMHYSGTVAARGTTPVTVDGSDVAEFNLVWFDGPSRNDLELLYYDDLGNPPRDSGTWGQTESTRGTESEWSFAVCDDGRWIQALKVVNHSDVAQDFHLYASGWYPATFATPDPLYTIGSPSAADGAIAVGAYVTRERFQNYRGDPWWYTYAGSYYDIASWSSRGPTVDGRLKPDLTAPGSLTISARDQDVYLLGGPFDWAIVDNDGDPSTVGYDYFVMQGTSMATPLAAGAAALLLERYPAFSPDDVREALTRSARSDAHTGDVANYTWGAGRLNLPYMMLCAGWNTLSFPGATATSPAAVFSPLIRPFHTRADNSNIYALHEPSGLYIVPAALERGTGYYVFSWLDGIPLSVAYGDMVALADTTMALSYSPGSHYPGWQILGNPYWTAINWEEALAQPGTSNVDNTYYVYSSKTGWQFHNVLTGGGGRDALIQPGEGFTVHACASPAALTVPNPVGVPMPKAVAAEEAPGAWRLQISATCEEGASDLYNYAGIHPEASDTYDGRDVCERPPLDGDAVMLYFPHPEWQEHRAGDYAQDVRRGIQGEAEWRVEVTCGASGRAVELSWPNIDRVPDVYALTLRDTDAGAKVDMRKTAIYAFTSRENAADPPVRHFTLLVRAAAMSCAGQEVSVPSSYRLDQNYPNPFNVETSVAYALPQDGFVRIVVCNLLGQEIRRLVEGHREAGQYRARWEGKDEEGDDVASGIYVCRMTTDAFSACQLMVLLR